MTERPVILFQFFDFFMSRKVRTYSKDEALVKNRREHIINCSIKLFLQKGYEETTTRELADACGISKGALYLYVGSKEDILYLIIDRAASGQVRVFEDIRNKVEHLSPTEALRQSIRIYFQSVDNSQELYIFINHIIGKIPKSDRHILLDAQDRIVTFFEDLLRGGIKAREFSTKDPQMVAFNILVLGATWAIRRPFLKRRYSLEEYIATQTEYIMGDVVTQKTLADIDTTI